MKIVLAPEGTGTTLTPSSGQLFNISLGEYEYNMFPTKLVDLVEEKIEEGIRHDGIEKHPGLRTPMELKLAASTAREYFENDKFWPFLLKEMNYIGSYSNNFYGFFKWSDSNRLVRIRNRLVSIVSNCVDFENSTFRDIDSADRIHLVFV